MNPFQTLQQMTAKQVSLLESFREFKDFIENLASAVEKSNLAPDTTAHLKSFKDEGLVILTNLFTEESRHRIGEQSELVAVDDIIQTAKLPRKDD